LFNWFPYSGLRTVDERSELQQKRGFCLRKPQYAPSSQFV